MELAIAAGIAYLGYRFSGATAPAKPRGASTAAKTTRAAAAAQQQPSDMLAADRAASADRWDAAQNPHAAGIITPNTKPGDMLPFFRSAKKQNTNDAVKQTRMELFTGMTETAQSTTGTWRHKDVSAARFDPRESAAPITSDGRAGNAPLDLDKELSRMRLTPKMNNVLPVQQLRVGPGVGVGSDIAATDGFHPMFRVLPSEDSLGAYRKSNLPGGMVAGKSRVDAQTSVPDAVTQHSAPRWYDADARPAQATGARNTTGPRMVEQFAASRGIRAVGEASYAGAPGRAGAHVPVTATRGSDRTIATPGGGPGRVAAGGYAHYTGDASRLDNQTRGVSLESGGAAAGPAARVPGLETFGAADLPLTQRDLTDAAPTGIVAGASRAGTTRPGDEFRGTLRGTTNQDAILAGGALVKRTQLDNARRYEHLDRTAKRGDQVTARVEAGRGAQVTQLPEAVTARRRVQESVVQSHGKAAQTPTESLGLAVKAPNALPVANPWVADLGLGVQDNALRLPAFAARN
jgi:hypothetical protein